MKRVAYLLRIREGKEKKYVDAHQNVWPELIEHLKEAGFRNYTIFKRGLDLFVYVEIEDFEKSLRNLINHPIYEKWAEKMDPIMEPHPDRKEGEMFPILSEVFHID
ncbi:L-rhamnose mutarotase [Acidobacteria bacterium AH-259-O06]|nr:L-rhamnose mutarotase [Acidobacteria bacterium AH-259-G07]MDA2930366.1 L-rhamnose mutarotase [Acidobacteria bacterium AH-259-O06]